MKKLLLFAGLFFPVLINAQISGKVMADSSQPAEKATVLLVKGKKKQLIGSAITDYKGFFSFDAVAGDSLQLIASSAGYQETSAGIGSNIVIYLNKSIKELSAVTVSSRKPMVEVLPDKMVLNVEGSINATGSNALELLQKSPGVVVDNNDNISLSGKNGVRIYIDGKPSPLGGRDLANFLRGLTSNDIEAIEIITSPSARYDAEGNAGILNIRLKRNKNFGWNGNLSAGYGVGIRPKFNGSTGLNFRNKNINWYSTISGYENLNKSIFNLHRIQNDTSFNAHSVTYGKSKGINIKTGLDYFLTKRSTLGVLLNSNINGNEYATNSVTPIGPASGKEIERVLTARNSSEGSYRNFTSNLNYRWADTSGSSIAVDADWGLYDLYNKRKVPNEYTDADGNPTYTYTFLTEAPAQIKISSLKADYEKKIGRGFFVTGFKGSLVNTDNDFRFFEFNNDDERVQNMDRSNRFIYKEKIYSAFAQYRLQNKTWQYQLGLRMEHTSSTGDLQATKVVDDKFVKREYTDLFPSAGVTKSIGKKNTLGLSYSRRIDRPKYQDLNPFENQLDELTFQRGNPFLRPQYTNAIELRHTYGYKLTTTLGYSEVKDVFAQVTDTLDKGRNFIQQRNLANQKIVSLNISYPFNLTKWWSVYASVNVNHNRYRADFGQGKSIALNATTANIFQQQTFQLGKGITAELSGFYNTPSIWGGTYKTNAIGNLDFGLQKKFWKDNATLKASVTDIFYTMPWKGVNEFGGLYIVASGQFESRQFKLNFTYRFGNKQVKSNNSRKTGMEDLNQRTNSSSN